MPINREPRCFNNHEVMRRELRDRELPPIKCPDCGWLLRPAKEKHNVSFTPEQEVRIFELIRITLRDLGLIEKTSDDD